MGYEKNVSFWVRDTPRVMGDLIARPSALHLGLKDMSSQEKRILEAGCGTGYFARLIAREIQKRGASDSMIVTAYDNNPDMLREATQEEYRRPLGIRYGLIDLTAYHKSVFTPFTHLLPIPPPGKGYKELPRHEKFDIIFCIGVMIHWTPGEIKGFLCDAAKALHHEGRIVISVTHPDLFIPDSPSRCRETNWVQHVPINDTFEAKCEPYGSLFEERYFDVDGQVFKSNVWAYTMEEYHRLFRPFLDVLELKVLCPQQEHLLHPSWGKNYDYPAFLQFVAKPCR